MFPPGAKLWGIERIQNIDCQLWYIYVYEKDGEFVEVAIPCVVDFCIEEFKIKSKTNKRAKLRVIK